MNGQRTILSNRKRFVFLAAMAAVLVFLAGGANALAIISYRVLCVPSHTINSSCHNPSPNPEYTSIQLAVSAANPFDTILVAPGTYHESVTIGTNSISLFGAQAGNDAREDRHDPTKESIVDAGGAGSAFTISASYVVIDGFTVQNGAGGGTPAGIVVEGNLKLRFLNNIVQNNSIGLYLDGFNGAAIERNLFRNNNNSAGGPTVVGLGIYAQAGDAVVITENEFSENKAAAMAVLAYIGATITENTSENDGSFVIFITTADSQFSHNRGKNFGHEGVLPAFSGVSADAAVDIAFSNSAVEISYNDLENGKTPISNGIAFTKAFGTGPSLVQDIVHNKIERFPGYGIVAEDPISVGTLNNSSIIGNEVEDNGLDGIYIDGVAGNVGNRLFDNEAEGNHGFDCHDDTSGTFTLGTANTWFNNSGNSSIPTGLCTPERRHNHDSH